MNPNPMGITEIKLIFEGNTNILQYKNEQEIRNSTSA